MKIGIIAELLRLGLRESIQRSAQLGATGIQIYADGNLTTLSDSELAEMKQYCNQCGVTVSAVCGDLGGHGFSRPEEQAMRIDQTMTIIDITEKLDSHVVTNHIGVVPSDTASREYKNMVYALRAVGRYAMLKNIVIAIETGPETPELLLQFLKDVDCKGIGVNMDPANLIMVQGSDPAAATRLLAPYIVHTHAKDGNRIQPCDPVKVYDAFAEGGFQKLVEETGELFREMPLGQGQIDWDAYLSALKEIGYDGYLTIEREVGEKPEQDIAEAVAFLKQRL